MADEADRAVIVTLFEVSFLEESYYERLCPLLGHFPVFHATLQMMVSTLTISSPPVWISSAGMLSTPGDFPFLRAFMTSSTSDLRIVSSAWFSMLSMTLTFQALESPPALWLYESEQYSVHLALIYCGSVKLSPFLSLIADVLLCLVHVRPFTVWSAVLLSFFFRLSSISLHWSSIHSCFAFLVSFFKLCYLFLCICVLLPLARCHCLVFFSPHTFLVYLGWPWLFLWSCPS